MDGFVVQTLVLVFPKSGENPYELCDLAYLA